MSINRTILSATIGQYGVKITYRDTGKPHTSFTLVCEELGRGEDKPAFKTFIPVLIVRPQAEACADTREPGDTVLLERKLACKAGKTKDNGKLQVMAFGVKRLTAAPAGSVDEDGWMIYVTLRDSFYVVSLDKCVLLLTKAAFIEALRRVQWWKRQHARQARSTPAE